MGTREIYVQARYGTDLRNPLQVGLLDNTPVKFSQATRRDTLDLRARMVEDGALTPWSGAAGYTVQAAIGKPGEAPLVIAESTEHDEEEGAFDISLDLDCPAIAALFTPGVLEVELWLELRISGPGITRRTFLQSKLVVIESVFAD